MHSEVPTYQHFGLLTKVSKYKSRILHVTMWLEVAKRLLADGTVESSNGYVEIPLLRPVCVLCSRGRRSLSTGLGVPKSV